MRKYVSSHLSNDPTARLVDPYMFNADVCRIHWSYRDYAKRKSRERMDGNAPTDKPSSALDKQPSGALDEKIVTKPLETVESKDGLTLVVSKLKEKHDNDESDSDDAMAKLDQLVGHLAHIMATDKTQPKEPPSFEQMKAICEKHEKDTAEKEDLKKPHSEEQLAQPEQQQVDAVKGRKQEHKKTSEDLSYEMSARGKAALERKKAREARRAQMVLRRQQGS